MKLDSKHSSHTLLLTEGCFLGGFRHVHINPLCAEYFPLNHSSIDYNYTWTSHEPFVYFWDTKYDSFQYDTLTKPGVVEPFAWWLQVRIEALCCS